MVGRGGSIAPPRPSSLDLDLKCDAQKGSDQHDQRKDRDALQRGIDRNGSDDVGGHEKFQAQYDRAAELLPQGVISRLQFEPLVDEGESAASQHAAQGDDPDAEQLESRDRDPDRHMWQISAHRHIRSMVIIDPHTPDVVP